MTLLYSSQVYDADSYGEDSASQEIIEYQEVQIDVDNPLFMINYFQKQTVQSEESMFNFFSAINEDVFYIIKKNVAELPLYLEDTYKII